MVSDFYEQLIDFFDFYRQTTLMWNLPTQYLLSKPDQLIRTELWLEVRKTSKFWVQWFHALTESTSMSARCSYPTSQLCKWLCANMWSKKIKLGLVLSLKRKRVYSPNQTLFTQVWKKSWIQYLPKVLLLIFSVDASGQSVSRDQDRLTCGSIRALFML